MTDRKPPRAEAEIFSELDALCSSPGYIHTIAYFCHRDNMIRYSGEMKPEDMRHLFSRDRLIRTETSTLIGLMLKHEISYEIPASNVMQSYIDRTERLLEELHRSMSSTFFVGFDPKQIVTEKFDPFASGKALREPIFYGGESAYSFQYRDFAVRKYGNDDAWVKANKGFSIAAARDVVRVIGQLADEKAVTTTKAMMSLPPDQWTILPASEFSVEELAHRSGIDDAIVEKVLAAFAVPEGERNAGFTALHEFNVANAAPLLRHGDKFILFQIYSLVEALYEAPFYWMGADKAYADTAMRNRGLFTEEFSVERLAVVFGKQNVYSNVDIVESKATKVGEIDALVIFGNRAVVLQAKSKRLTLAAKKGNDRQIKNDFKKSVQDAYDQGLICAKFLLDRRHAFVDGQDKTVIVPALKEVYVLCVVSDHYPALSFQAKQFLKVETTDAIPPPFVLDVFTLDAMTEMLDTPLFLLSYIDRRVKYSDRLMASHELTILSYHIKQSLWLSDEYNLVMLEDDISTDLDLAMLARREGIPARKTPDGILTRLRATTVGGFVQQIETRPDAKTIDLGFMLLTISEDSAADISRGINRLAEMARADGTNHDISAGFDAGATGLTVHCNDDPLNEAVPRLEAHCYLRKYSRKARTWFGVCVRPSEMSMRFGVNLDFPWERDHEMEAAAKAMPKSHGLAELLGATTRKHRRKRKPGRNEPCLCGSGKKYKKCCGAPGSQV
jgi:hypothetical protein